MKILEASAKEAGGYKLVIFSGGQPSRAEVNTKNLKIGDVRRGDGPRHDDGYAADIYTFNEIGRHIKASGSKKDVEQLAAFVAILLKNGIGSVGADTDYMSGNIHVDIAHRIPGKNVPKACWGQGPDGANRWFHAPDWLQKLFGIK